MRHGSVSDVAPLAHDPSPGDVSPSDVSPNDVSPSALFAAALTRWAEKHFLHLPDEAARHYGMQALTMTYAQAAPAVDALAARYAARGFGPGGRLALMMENRPHFFLHFLALNRLGVAVVPLAAQAAAELAGLIARARVGAVIAAAPLLPLAREAAGAAGVTAVPEDDLESLPAQAPGARSEIGPDSLAALLFTSGTTGRPKACRLTNAYFHRLGRRYVGMGGLAAVRPGAERILTPLPVNHMNALAASFTGALMAGACLIQLDRFHPRQWWDTVRASEATLLHYLGVMPALLLRLPETAADADIGAQVRFGFGAGVDPRHHGAFEARFGFPLIEAWAMTETGGAGFIAAAAEPRHVGRRCFGRAPPDLAYRLVDEQGHDVSDGAPGELWVRTAGPDPRRYFFDGYDGDDAATEEAWAGGWFHTGDVVRADAEGLLFFVDRNKNIVRRSGENIAAVEVEGVLAQHPGVVAVAVAPIPDEIRGEEVKAYVQLVDGARPELVPPEELVAFCADKLAAFKVPRYVEYRLTDFPRTPSMRIQKEMLKRERENLVAGVWDRETAMGTKLR